MDLIKRAALRLFEDRANNYLCPDGSFPASQSLRHKTISCCPRRLKIAGEGSVLERMTHFIYSHHGPPKPIRGAHRIIAGGIREEEQSEMADCSSPVIDLLTPRALRVQL